MNTDQFELFVLQITDWIVNAIPNFIAAILILALGWFAARTVSRLITRLMAGRMHVDQTLTPVLATFARYTILTITLIAVLGQMGMQIASALAVLGAAGLAIGLALQGTLSNIAAGLMLLWLRPFRTGEYIDAEGIAGSVTEVGLFATTLRTGEGIYHFVPNSALWNKPILNFARNTTRRMDIAIGIDYGDDIQTARKALLGLAAADERVLADPAPQVIVSALADSSVNLTLRCWAPTDVFWAAQWDLTEGAKRVIEQAGLSIPFPQSVVHQTGPVAAPTEKRSSLVEIP